MFAQVFHTAAVWEGLCDHDHYFELDTEKLYKSDRDMIGRWSPQGKRKVQIVPARHDLTKLETRLLFFALHCHEHILRRGRLDAAVEELEHEAPDAGVPLGQHCGEARRVLPRPRDAPAPTLAHLLAFSHIRTEFDRIWEKEAFPEAEQRQKMENLTAPDRFRLPGKSDTN